MFLWVGAVFDNNTENEIRSIANKLNKDYGLSTVAFSLPQHISLKISFECDDYQKVIDFIKTRFLQFSPFEVEITDISKIDGSLIWLEIKENDILRQMHNLLNESLLKEFGIPLKSFDGKDFKFHSTLFFDDCVNSQHQRLIDSFKKEFSLPKSLSINEINFGISDTLTAGAFTVVDKLTLKK